MADVVKTIYFAEEQVNKQIDTLSHIVLLANAPEYTDQGYVLAKQGSSNLHNYQNAITLQGSDACFTVGGNYTGGTSNVELSSSDSLWRWSGHAGSGRKDAELSWSDLAAVAFLHSGSVSTIAQSGARTATYQNMDDELIQIVADVKTEMKTPFAIDATLENSLTISGFRAVDTLTFSSTATGIYDVKNFYEIVKFYYTDLKGASYFALTTNANDSAFGVSANDVIFLHGIQADVTADIAQSKLNSIVSRTATDCWLTAVGFYAYNDFRENEEWSGNVTANSNDIIFKLDAEEALKTTTVDFKPTVIMTDSKLGAAAVEAANNVTISCIKGNVQWKISADNMLLYASSLSTAAAKTTVTDSLFYATAVKGSTVTIDEVEKGAFFSVSLDNTLLYAGMSGDSNSVATVNGNEFLSAGIYGSDKVQISNFEGTIEVSAVGNTFSYSGLGVGASGVDVNVYGIHAKNTLSSDANLGGTISLTSQNNCYWYYNPYLTGFLTAAGLSAATIKVDGRIDTDIFMDTSTLASGAPVSTQMDAGILANRIITEAYSGTIGGLNEEKEIDATLTPYFGILARNSLESNYTGDSFDVTGSIYAQNVGIFTGLGTTSTDTKGNTIRVSSLRVSGAITVNGGTSNYAIHTEGYYTSRNSDSLVYIDTACDDLIEIAAGGVINGNIEMRRGTNRLLMDSSAKITGATTALGGLVTYTFLLNGDPKMKEHPEDDAVITTNELDYSLKSTATFGVNLDNAVNSDNYLYYRLFYYADLEFEDVAGYWENKKITFTYQGQEQVVQMGWEKTKLSATATFSDGTTATIKVEGKSIVVSDITIVDQPDSLTIEEFGLVYDSFNYNCTLTWSIDNSERYKYFEVEYSVNDGKTIVVRQTAAAAGENNLTSLSVTVSGLYDADILSYRVRGVDIDNNCATYYSKVSTWNEWENYTCSVGTKSLIVMDNVQGTSSGGYDKNARIEGAAAVLSWDEPESAMPIKYYIVQYVESLTKSTAEEIFRKVDSGEITPTSTKTTTACNLPVSSLTERSFVYWRIRAVDVNFGGTVDDAVKADPETEASVSQWTNGDTIHIYYGDKTSPEITLNSRTWKSDGLQEEYNNDLSLTFNWTANDSEGEDPNATGLKYTVIEVSGGGTTYKPTVQANTEPGKYDYEYTLTGLKAGTYTYTLTAHDNMNQCSTQAGVITIGDYQAPEEVNLTHLEKNKFENPDNWNEDIQITFYWNAAEDPLEPQKAEDAAGGVKFAGSGIASYLVSITIGTTVYSQEFEAGQESYKWTVTDENGGIVYVSGGDYEYSLTITDYAGNVTVQSGTASFGDYDGPEMESTDVTNDITEHNDSDNWNNKCTWRISWGAAIDLMSGVKDYQVTVTSGTTTYFTSDLIAHDDGVDVYSCNIENMNAGTTSPTVYTYTITARDKALNATAISGTFSFGDFIEPTLEKTSFSCSVTAHKDADDWNNNCSLTITWGAAEDEGGAGVKDYQITLTNGTTTYTSDLVAHQDGKKTYSYTFDGIRAGTTAAYTYTYTITARDNALNTSEESKTYSFGDFIAPVLPAQDVSVYSYRCDSSDYLKMAVCLSWDAATDTGGSGLKGYRVTVSNGSSSKTVTVASDVTSCVVSGIDAGTCSWSITAIDNALNESTSLTGTHRTESAPRGSFDTINTPDIYVSYGESETIQTDEDDASSSITVTPIETAYAKFSWTDSYIDVEDGVYYRVQISDNTSFVDNVYEYRTTVNGEKSLTLDQTPTFAVGILSQLSNGNPNTPLYYRVMATNGLNEDTGIWSAVRSFCFQQDGNGVTHVQDPDKPDDVTVSLIRENYCYQGKIKVSWTNEQTDLGINSYVINVICDNKSKNTRIIPIKPGTIKDSGGSGEVSTVSGTIDLAAYDCLSGEYSFTVTALNAVGDMTTSDSVSFTLDMVRPTKVKNVKATAVKNDIVVTWDASSDAFGIAYYEVMYRRSKGASDTQEDWTLSKKCTNRSFLISDLGDGYGFDICVYAYDKNGNRSLQSDIIQSVSSSSNDLCDYYNPLLWRNLDDISSSGLVKNTIGVSDAADYFYFTSDLSFSLTTVAKSLKKTYGSSKGVKVQVYKYDGTGTEKAVASFTLNKAGDSKSNVLLKKGTYFVKITAKNQKTVSDYKLSFKRSTFANTRVNTSADDNWKTLDTSTYPVIYVKDMKTAKAKKDWVGFGDSVDYRVLQTQYAGRFTVSLMNVSAPVTLTVYSNENGTLKKVKSISASSGSNSAIVLLESKNTKTYYVKVSAQKASSGKNSYYSWKVTAVSQYRQGNNADDNWSTLDRSKYSLAYGSSFSDWVGFGDSTDYRKLDLTYSGNYKLKISGLTNAASVTVYKVVNYGWGQTLQKVKSISVKSGSKTLSNLLLESNSTAVYYVAVKATKASKVKNTSYKLALSGTVYDAAGANNEDDRWQYLNPEKYTVTCGSSVKNEWVGLGDSIDYRKLDLPYAGKYNFTLSNVRNGTTLTIYRKDGDELAVVDRLVVQYDSDTLSGLLLKSNEKATYYVGVSCNNPATAQNSEYQLDISGTQYTLGRTGDDWDDLLSNGGSGAVGSFGEIDQNTIGTTLDREDDKTGERGLATNWVGFGDATDYVGFSVQERSCEMYFDVQTNGKISFTVYELAGEAGSYHLVELQKTVLTESGTTGKLLLDGGGDYFIGITSLTASSGGSANYSVAVSSKTKIHAQPYNGDDTWQQLIPTENYSVLTKGESMLISGWVGYGDQADYHKFQQWDRTQMELTFDDVTGDAICDGKLKVCVIDSNGEDCTSKFRRIDDYDWVTDEEMLGGIYYVGFTCTNPEKYNTNYQATLTVGDL